MARINLKRAMLKAELVVSSLKEHVRDYQIRKEEAERAYLKSILGDYETAGKIGLETPNKYISINDHKSGFTLSDIVGNEVFAKLKWGYSRN